MTSINNALCHGKGRRRAEPSGVSLTTRNAEVAKGMLLRGDRAHDVAAYFGVNPGRIAEIATGAKFSEVSAAPASELPPPGPYLRPCETAVIQRALATARRELEQAEQLLNRPLA